ncbi:MAG: PTS sugar transporter subunit IIA [candidate division Zixibacteria bacterium]|nr:PTS sugar transporter subunit IIA [candidate division Zixibacteria bacterium]
MGFNITRHMTPELIKLDMSIKLPEMAENGSRKKWLNHVKEAILLDLIGVLDPTGKIGNQNKLFLDFINREKKASTGIGSGFAIPHIRSMQAKEFMIGYGRSLEGYEYDAIDDMPVNHFFIMAAPPYEDGMYLKAFKALSEMIMFDGLGDKLMQAKEPYDVIRAMRELE